MKKVLSLVLILLLMITANVAMAGENDFPFGAPALVESQNEINETPEATEDYVIQTDAVIEVAPYTLEGENDFPFG